MSLNWESKLVKSATLPWPTNEDTRVFREALDRLGHRDYASLTDDEKRLVRWTFNVIKSGKQEHAQ